MSEAAMRRGLERLFERRVSFDEPLSRHTSMRVGGPADALAEAWGEEELVGLLALCRSSASPLLVVGGGNNLIVRDGGFRGIAVKLGGRLAEARFEGLLARAGGGAALGGLAAEAIRRGLAGLERLAGIPGTVGGAVRMNAGAFGAAIGDLTTWARLADADGVRRVEGRDMGFGYRRCEAAASGVVVEAGFVLGPSDPRRLAAEAEACAARRDARLPKEPNAGCVFRNPGEGPAAGELIDRAGFRGAREGGAEVHPAHANVIVNRGGATAADVLALMRRIADRIREEGGISLEPEVVVVGEEAAAGA